MSDNPCPICGAAAPANTPCKPGACAIVSPETQRAVAAQMEGWTPPQTISIDRRTSPVTPADIEASAEAVFELFSIDDAMAFIALLDSLHKKP